MWPFKKNAAESIYILATGDGVVTKVMYDYVIVNETRYDTLKPLVELGARVKKGQPIGKR